MKKYCLYVIALVIIFLTNASYSSDQRSYEKKIIRDTNKVLNYTIQVNYPLFNNGQSTQRLNQIIKQKIAAQIENFKKNIDKSGAAYENGPQLDTNSNTLETQYKIYSNDDIISIRFSNDKYFYGAAHPNIDYFVINYDVKHNKLLSLKDVFNTDSDYLDALSRYAKRVLTKKLTKAAESNTTIYPDETGIGPTDKNYQLWNMTQEGILLTFPAYQVAPYVFGPQEVLVPYDTLKDLMRDDNDDDQPDNS